MVGMCVTFLETWELELKGYRFGQAMPACGASHGAGAWREIATSKIITSDTIIAVTCHCFK